MIKIIAHFYVKNTEVDKAKRLTEDVVTKTRQEKGCISYEVFQDESDQGHLTFVESWAGEAEIEAHGKTMHFLNFVARMKEIHREDKEIVIDRYSQWF